MGYFQPKVIYFNVNEKRENSVIRYIGNRVINSNKNFLCAIVGPVGIGKSYCGLKIAELYSQMYNVPFEPEIHVISSLKEILMLITEKKKRIKIGSIIMFDEPQTEANSRSWQSEANKALNQLTSTFRNQRLVVLFVTPYVEFLDKQSRMLFHGEFKVEGYDKHTGITTIKPRFLEWNKSKQDFYRKRLLVQYKVPNKSVHQISKLSRWHIGLASKKTIDVYEAKKKQFTDELNQKLLNNIVMQERQSNAMNKSEELEKVKELYEKYGEDYIAIMKEMPHLTPNNLRGYVMLVKKTKSALKEQKKKIDKPRCSNCGSTLVYVRQRDRVLRCRLCGYEEKLDKKSKNLENNA